VSVAVSTATASISTGDAGQQFTAIERFSVSPGTIRRSRGKLHFVSSVEKG
jgi:hypothetical protein